MTTLGQLQSGDLIDGRYSVRRPLGSGGGGSVYAAFDQGACDDAESEVAIKVIAGGELDEGMRSGLELEFSLLARMSHPNLVAARAIGVTRGGGVYLVEELIRGPTLDDARDRLEPADYFSVAHGILAGLDHIHRRGWVHHDIKPANIMLAPTPSSKVRDWVPKIADLGVASLRGSDPRGRVSGTVPFLSPERLVGKLADPRCDVWALGMTLLYCITGVIAVDTNEIAEAARILNTRRPPALRDLRPDAPAGLERVIARMLARERRTRYRDGADALAGLRREIHRADLELPAVTAESVAQSPALIGRDAVLSAVLEILRGRRRARGRAVSVRGKLGSGRTRILREVALELQLEGARAVFVAPGIALEPWRRALSELRGPLVESTELGLEAVVDAIVESIDERPAVLLIDDAGERDSVARYVLERLLDALAATPPNHTAGVVIGEREGSEWSPLRTGFAEIVLRPLGDRELTELGESVLGRRLAPSAGRLVAAAAGNPARLLDLIRSALARGALSAVAGAWELTGDRGSPLDPAQSDHLRLVSVDGDALTLLCAIAICGPPGTPVELDVASRVSALTPDRFSAATASLCRSDLASLVGEPGSPGRRLVLELAAPARAALARLGDQRFELHRRALAMCSEEPLADPAAVAYHAHGAGYIDQAVSSSCAAAESALAARDYASVLSVTEIASDLFDAGDRELVARLRVARAKALVALSQPLDAARLAASVLEANRDDLGAAMVVVRAAVTAGDTRRVDLGLAALSSIAERSGSTPIERAEITVLEVEASQLTLAPRQLEKMARERLPELVHFGLEKADLDRAAARVALAVGGALVYGGYVSDGLPWLDNARAVFLRLRDHAQLAEVEVYLAAAADQRGDAGDRSHHIERGLASAERAGADSAVARLLNIRGLARLWKGATDEAREAFEEAERRSRRAGLYKVVSAVSGNLVVVERRAGLFGRALAAARRSLRVKGPLGDRTGAATTLLNLSDIYFDIGATNLATAAARRVVRAALAAGHDRLEVAGRVALACAEIGRGELAAAREHLGTVAARRGNVARHAELEVELARASLEAAAGERVAAADRLREIGRSATRRDEPFLGAWAAYRRGVVLADVGAVDLARAVELASVCGARHLAWMARAQHGMLLSAEGQSSAAAGELARAKELLAEVLEDLPPRHYPGYIAAAERAPLIAAIRAGGFFPAPARHESRVETVPTTVAEPVSNNVPVFDTEVDATTPAVGSGAVSRNRGPD